LGNISGCHEHILYIEKILGPLEAGQMGGFLNNFLRGRELEINGIIEISTMTTEPSSSFLLYFILFFIAYK
jgi:hypothetical protein